MSGYYGVEYLSGDKAARLEELIAKGTQNLDDKEGSEFAGLMFEVVDNMKEAGVPQWPAFDGTCRRCGRVIDNPVPEVTHPEGIHEIASSEWCADCNAFIMSIVYRGRSAFDVLQLADPTRGGQRDAG